MMIISKSMGLKMTDHSAALPRGMYRDPLDVVLFEESRTCLGCVFVAVAFGTEHCEKGKQYGKRCKFYREAENG